MKNVVIYTDGSAPENAKGHGRGGYCAILVSGEREKVVSGSVPNTTNNQMELRSVLEGLKALRVPCDVTVVTDSKLVIGWLSEGWKCKDYDCAIISRQIDALIEEAGHQVRFEYVRGHTGHPMNERCDSEARKQSDSLIPEISQSGS